MSPLYLYFSSAFLLSLLFGWMMAKTGFCSMGAVTDQVVMGDSGRLAAWWAAIALATLAFATLRLHYNTSLSATIPHYSDPHFPWLRFLLGGAMFGIGMTLTGGCALRSLIKSCGGNLKSLLVLLVMAYCAFGMVRLGWYEQYFYPWVRTVEIDLTHHQSANLTSFLSLGMAPEISHLLWALILCVLGAVWMFRIRRHAELGNLLLSAASLGGVVALTWWITMGPIGQASVAHAQFSDFPPVRVGPQALTYVQPWSQLGSWLSEGLELSQFTFSLAILFGTLGGAAAYHLWDRSWHWQWFQNVQDLFLHVLGAILMGIGGVLALGCTIGQGISGMSTLALGSMLATLSIILASAWTVKLRYRFA